MLMPQSSVPSVLAIHHHRLGIPGQADPSGPIARAIHGWYHGTREGIIPPEGLRR